MSGRIYVQIVSIDAGEADWPGQRADELLAWFNSKIEQAPPEFQSEVMITIQPNSGYGDDSCSTTIDIGYYRPESDKEIVVRLQFEEARQQNLLKIESVVLGAMSMPLSRILSDNAMREWRERNSPKGGPPVTTHEIVSRFDYMGGFASYLGEAWFRGDADNQARIENAFAHLFKRVDPDFRPPPAPAHTPEGLK